MPIVSLISLSNSNNGLAGIDDAMLVFALIPRKLIAAKSTR